MFDTVIIGAGVTGSAIARELSRYQARILVVEREEDVCCGTSKANSAIVHAGFDAEPGSLKAEMNVKGNRMMDQIAQELDVPFKRNGSIVVCTKDQDPAGLEKLAERGRANGVPTQILSREALLEKEPNLADDVTCGLFAPSLNTQVRSIEKSENGWRLTVYHRDTQQEETIETKTVVNAAGVYADEFNNMVSAHKMHITARKGEYILLDKTAGKHVSSTIFQLPTAMGKGVLVTPTVHGNLLVGPTAVDVDDKEAVNTTPAGLEAVQTVSARSVRNVPLRQVITSFAGLRAHEDGDDFIIAQAQDAPGFVNAAGIESPGLSSAPAIGVRAAQIIRDILHLTLKDNFNPIRKAVLRPSSLSLEERNELIRRNPAYGNIICRCEMITEGEIMEAIHRPLGARSLDGVKRRTRAGMGRCQAGFCTPRTMEILEREVPMSVFEVGKNGIGSNLVVGINKEV